MSLAALEKILKRPITPHELGNPEGWGSVEEQLKMRLPQDYKQFIEVFGTRKIGDFIGILNPFSENEFVNLIKSSKGFLEADEVLRKKHPKDYVYDFYPEQGGPFPFGVTDNGDVLYWKTEGEPDRWPVVIFDPRESEQFEFPG